MNVLSRIIKELAQDFRIPEKIEQHLYMNLFSSMKTKGKRISEQNENGIHND
jgi:hypothetical protein